MIYEHSYIIISKGFKMQLIDYEQYVKDNNFASAEKSGYYVAWVKRFLKLNISDRLNNYEKLKQFRDYLNVSGNLQDWQRDQGMHAVEIYLNMYLANVKGVSSSAPHPDLPSVAEKMRTALRLKHYAYRTEQTYLDWVRKYFNYCYAEKYDYKAGTTVKLYLSYLATGLEVAASTQNQAFNSLLFLFRNVFEIELGDISGAVRAKAKKNLPVVLSVNEIKQVFEQITGTKRMILELIYGTGLRVSELTRLRVMNLDFDHGILIVKDGKGGKDRSTPLPKKIMEPLREHLLKVKEMHDEDLRVQHGEVYLPPALARKYPNAGREWKWQYVFPSAKLAVDPRSGKVRRHHILDKTVQTIMRKAVNDAKIPKKATVHSLRHSFATHLLMSGVNIREIQELLGHKNLETTMIYTHVARELWTTPNSPLDML
jgi:integron integrase